MSTRAQQSHTLRPLHTTLCVRRGERFDERPGVICGSLFSFRSPCKIRPGEVLELHVMLTGVELGLFLWGHVSTCDPAAGGFEVSGELTNLHAVELEMLCRFAERLAEDRIAYV